MIHPHTEIRFISKEKGFGVVATEFIPKGTITWAMDKLDRIFKEIEVQKMSSTYRKIIDTYTFRDSAGNYILCWDNARFVNHSFNSNCISTAYEFELAVRDIYPGEELTDDYGYLNISEPFECIREDGSERTTVYPDDLLRYSDVWDKKLIDAFSHFNNVQQPLSEFLENNILLKAQTIGNGKLAMDSIINCYFNKSKSKLVHK